MKKRILKRVLSVVLLACIMVTELPVNLLAGETGNAVGRAGTLAGQEVGDYQISVSRGESGEETAIIDRYLGNDENVTVPETIGGYQVIEIGEYAFVKCTFLTEITLPDGVTSIGDGAFMGCLSLTDISLPDSVTSIGQYAFSETAWLNRQKQENELVILKHVLIDGTGCNGRVEIPDGVTVIGERAFDYCTSLTEITLPDGVISIGEYAFTNCTSLTNITLPDSVTSIGESAFSSCTSLTEITIPDSVTSIGKAAFLSCASLTGITLPDSVTSIGESAFSSCTSLTNITIPDSVTSIGDAAFSSCTSLTEITLPDGVTSIGKAAFEGCTSLTEITIPDSMTSIGESAFSSCASLTNITIPDSVTSIGESAFSSCTSLTNITIPDSVTSIGDQAFSSCVSLTEIAISDSVAAIGYDAFYKTAWLNRQKQENELVILKHVLIDGTGCDGRVEIPDDVTVIGDGAFYNCNFLTEIMIPDSVTSIGDQAFSFTPLTGITLPNSVTSIGSAFSNCNFLTAITIPDSVTSIGEYAFSNCTSLTNITIPDSVTSIGDGAFVECTSLTEITIPNSVTSIGDAAFESCTSLTKITLPDSVTSIGDAAFSKCMSLTEIIIPDSVTSIGDRAFSSTSLTNITIPNSVTSIGDQAFSSCVSLTEITIPDSVTSIGQDAFLGCASLTEITMPDSVTSIGDAAFESCTSLTGITIPDSVTSIGRNAFRDCPELVLLVVPDSYAEQYATENEIPFDYCIDESVATLRVTLSPSEADLNLQGLLLSIDNKNYHASRRLASETQYRFGGVMIGEDYTVSVSNDYGDIISKLDHVAFQAGINQIELKDFAALTNVNARVMAEEEDVTGQCVVEWLDGEGNSYASGMSLCMVPVGKKLLCRVQLDEELSHMYEVPEDMAWTASAQDLDCVINLAPLQAESDGAVLNILAEYTARTDEGDVPEPQILDSLSGLSFDIANMATGMPVSRYVIQGNSLVFSEGVNAGDTLSVTVSSRKNDFAPESRLVTVGSDNEADAEFAFAQFGALKAEYQDGGNSATRLLVYGADGALAWTGADKNSGTLQSGSLPDGRYTALVMGDSQYLAYPVTLKEVDGLGLAEGRDYISKSVNIITGKNTAASFGKVPVFSEERFYISNPQETQFALSKLETNVGKYVTLRATAPLKPEYEGRVSEVKWIFKLPEQCELISGTLSANGTPCRDVAYEGDEMIVSSIQPKDMIRMCLMPLEMGSYALSGSLQYTLDGRTVRQPVGQLTLKADEASIQLPSKTMSEQITVSGTATALAEVSVYDNGELAGQATAGLNGRWSLDVALNEPYTYSEHDISAEIETATGQVFRTEEKTLTYQYVKEPVTADRVTMIYHGRSMTFDFNGNAASSGNYSYIPGTTSFTFVVKMTGRELDKVSNLQLNVLCSDGNTKTFYPSFDKKKEQWSVSGDFYAGALPQNVSVRYDYDAEIIVSSAQQKQIMTGFNYFINFAETNPVKEIELPPEAPVSDETKEAYEEYNNALKEVENASKEFSGAIRNIEADDTGMTVQTDGISLEKKQVPSMPEQEIISKGYTPVPSDGEGPSSYHKSEETPGGFKQIILTPADNQTGNVFEQTTILIPNSDSAQKDLEKMLDAGSKIPQTIGKLNKSAIKAQKATKKEIDKIKFTMEDQGDLGETQWLTVFTDILDALLDSEAVTCVLETSTNTKALDAIVGTAVASAILKAFSAFRDLQTLRTKWKQFRSIQEWMARCVPECKCLSLIKNLHIAYIFVKLLIMTKVFDVAGKSIMAFFGLGGWIVKMFMSMAINVWDWWMDKTLSKHFAHLNGSCKKCNPIRNKCEECDCKDDPDNPVSPDYENTCSGTGFTGIVDPSGYVYEAVASNRLSGVTATCYEKVTKYDIYDEPYEVTELWDAEPYEQMNPLLTNDDGSYAWDVPQGLWQVRYEKEGYEPAESEWMEVPPPRFDINVGLVSREEPAILKFTAYPDEFSIMFSKYIQTSTVTAETVKFSTSGREISGRLVPLDEEESPEDGTMLASKFSFVPDEPLAKGNAVEATATSGIATYAGISPKQALAAPAQVILKPESFSATQKLTLPYDGEGALELSAVPAKAVAGMEVSITNRSPMLASLQADKAVLDENGKASVPVKALLPGQCVIEFALNGSSLTAQSDIAIQNPDAGGADDNQTDDGPADDKPGDDKPADDGMLFDLAGCKAEIEYISCTYDGSPKRPAVTVKRGESMLNGGTDYSVSYSGNINAGTAYAVISGKGRYTGTVTLPFVIHKAENVITASDVTKTVSSKKQTFSIRAESSGNGALTYKSNSKSVKVNGNGKVTVAKNFIGKAVITILAASSENYKDAQKKINVLVNPAGVNLSKVTDQGKGKIQVKWKKNGKADGYEIQYSTNSKFSGSSTKIKQVKKRSASSCTISKLKKGKTYYVRIRTYKKVSGKKYVSAWSGKKKVRKSY